MVSVVLPLFSVCCVRLPFGSLVQIIVGVSKFFQIFWLEPVTQTLASFINLVAHEVL